MQAAWYAAMIPAAVATVRTGGKLASNALENVSDFASQAFSPNNTPAAEPSEIAGAADSQPSPDVASDQIKSWVSRIRQALQSLGLPSDLNLSLTPGEDGRLQVSALDDEATPWVEAIQGLVDQNPQWSQTLQQIADEFRSQSEAPHTFSGVGTLQAFPPETNGRNQLVIQMTANDDTWSWR